MERFTNDVMALLEKFVQRLYKQRNKFPRNHHDVIHEHPPSVCSKKGLNCGNSNIICNNFFWFRPISFPQNQKFSFFLSPKVFPFFPLRLPSELKVSYFLLVKNKTSTAVCLPSSDVLQSSHASLLRSLTSSEHPSESSSYQAKNLKHL